jgi:hypothetical protein
MYRIELAPGEETVFRTIEELAVAVRNGLVTPRCRIYHNATQKWLPIEFHPHYKQALSLPAARIAEAVAPRTSGHPPRLETLSFAVAPAAKSTPVPEPVADLAAEARAADHPVQPPAPPRSQVEQSAKHHSLTKRPVGVQRVGQQGTELRGAERSGEEHSTENHSAAEPAGAEHPGADHLDARYSGLDHPVTEHPANSAVPRTAADEAAAQATVEHPVLEHSSAAASPAELPVTESPYPAAEQHFASHADTAAAPSLHAEPAPAPKSKSSYRPDSYLPASVRAIADDPYIAIAPEPAAVPSVPAAPRRSWSMMPAVQETPELPAISYPEITPAEEPVAERANSSRGHRPLQVAVALLVLAAGGYLARSFYSPVHGSHVDNSSTPAAAVADRPALPEDAPPPVPSAVRTKSSPNRPAVITPTAPASSGFAAALEPRAIATGPAPILPAHAAAAEPSSAASAADSNGVTGTIAPAPTEMQMDVPALPGGDSLVVQPRSKSDSAMKRILRAVTGGRDVR